MKISCILPFALLAFCLPANSQDDAAAKPVTASEALKAGQAKLAAKLGDESESGNASAAVYYATAKRLDTEAKLGAKDLSLVLDLQNLRQIISAWDDAWCEAQYTLSGGGSMWVHFTSTNDAVLEDLLADLAKKLPFKPGNADATTLGKWATVEKAVTAAKLPKDIKESDPEAEKVWKEQKAALLKHHARLDVEMQAIPNDICQIIMKHIMPDKDALEALK
jgi:hypothetical protein